MDQQSPAPSTHDFLQVARLVPMSQQVVSVQADTRVRDALKIMRTSGFDQLPVCAGEQVIGVFSYRSLATSLAFVRRNDDPLDLTVLDAIEDLAFVRAADEVGTILELLERNGAVGVGDQHRLDAVMTASDVTRYLWQATRPFVLLQDIELGVRSLMHSACLTAGEMPTLLNRALPKERLLGEEPPTKLVQLTMAELLAVLLHAENYGRTFSAVFGMNKAIVASALEPVREVRNKVFHFRDEVTGEELDILVAARQYLRRRVEAAKARRT